MSLECHLNVTPDYEVNSQGGWLVPRVMSGSLCIWNVKYKQSTIPWLMRFQANVWSWQVIYQSMGPGFSFNQEPKYRVCACSPQMTQSRFTGARKSFEDQLVAEPHYIDEFWGLLRFAQQDEWQSWDWDPIFLASSLIFFPASPSQYIPISISCHAQITSTGHSVFSFFLFGKFWMQVTKILYYLAKREYVGKVLLFSHSRAQLFATPWTIALQASLSMEFSRQEFWNVLLVGFKIHRKANETGWAKRGIKWDFPGDPVAKTPCI